MYCTLSSALTIIKALFHYKRELEHFFCFINFFYLFRAKQSKKINKKKQKYSIQSL